MVPSPMAGIFAPLASMKFIAYSNLQVLAQTGNSMWRPIVPDVDVA
jgi:hypothetical protein